MMFSVVVPGANGILGGCDSNSNGHIHHNDICGGHLLIANFSGSSPSEAWHVGVIRQKGELQLKGHVLVIAIARPMGAASSREWGTV